MLTTDFKNWCENQSILYRRHLNLEDFAPLPARMLAQFLEVTLLRPDQIPEFSRTYFKHLQQSTTWSAVLLPVPSPIIIYNPTHSSVRFESNIMHELAHLICGHKPEDLSPISGNFFTRCYPLQNEKEAEYFGGCLQIPGIALRWASQRELDIEEIAHHYHASTAMVQFRANMNGKSL